MPESALPKTTTDGCGPMLPEPFATYDPDTSCWRMSQASLLGEWETYSAAWPRSGTMRSGKCVARPALEHHTNANASGLLPTPMASDARDRGHVGHPSVQRRMRIGKQIGLSMLFEKAPCPLCVEGMMGYPLGWTSLPSPPSETLSSRKS